MHKFGSLYVEADSFFHRLNPVVKLSMFVAWLVAVFMFLDLRVSIGLLITGFIFLWFAKIPYRIARNLFIAIGVFNLINALFILLLAPDYGVTLTGVNDIVLDCFGLKIYRATLMYILVISLKYLSLLPLTIIFIFTTHPGKFAASLNKVGIPYKLAYTVNIIFRYFPDIREEFKIIANAQAARGFSFGKDEPSKLRRIKNLFNITVPLINSALARIDKVSNAMELRSFGKNKTRTWYNQSDYSLIDIVTLLFIIVIFFLLLYFRLHSTGRFITIS